MLLQHEYIRGVQIVSITIIIRCYDYVIPGRALTWIEAMLSCVERGGHLASLETPEEWSAVIRALSIRTGSYNVYMGLRVLKMVQESESEGLYATQDIRKEKLYRKDLNAASSCLQS